MMQINDYKRWYSSSKFIELLPLTCLAIFWIGFYGCARAGGFVDKTASLAPGLSDAVAAWGDYNNDGYTDLNAGGYVWRNDGGTGFTLIFRYGKGGPWADYDNDGLLDIYSVYNKSIYRNSCTCQAEVGPL